MRILATGILCLAVAACDTPNFRTTQFQFGEAKTLAATGNLRFVTERVRHLPRGDTTVLCTEPMPDYAVASGTDANGTIKATTTSPISEGSLALKTTELVTPLEGRSQGVLALRDGLYAACQAYVNGMIGKDAYSLILSQYGLLLVGIMQPASSITLTGDAAKKPLAVATAQAQAASPFAAMLVSCINEYDPTRRDYPPERAPFDHNRMLSPAICGSVIKLASSGRMK